MSETGDYLRGIFNGEIPVKRKNPQTGETENVYYKYDDDREELIETASVEKDTTTKAYSKYLKDMIFFRYTLSRGNELKYLREED